MTEQIAQAVADTPAATETPHTAPSRRRFKRSKNHDELSKRIASASGSLVTRRFSIPIYERTVTLNSLESQRVIESVYGRTMRALYNIDVILRFIGDAENTVMIWKIIDEKIATMRKSLNDEKTRLEIVISNEGVTQSITYGRPITETFMISSPSALDFIEAIVTLDEVIGLADRLWFARVMSREERFAMNGRWQRRVEALGNTVFGIARRAMEAARRVGREAEIAPHLQIEEAADAGAADGAAAAEKADSEALGAGAPEEQKTVRPRATTTPPDDAGEITVEAAAAGASGDGPERADIPEAAE